MKKIITLLFITVLFVAKVFSQSSTVYIPTVFHVLWNNSSQNISDTYILQQLQVMNADYSDITCQNTYAQDVNTNIQFCLAAQDPSGNPTNGIIHKQTTSSSFSQNDAVKFTAQGGDDAWDRDKYLNIWVCNLGGGLLGYSQFPGGLSSTDGVVIRYSTVPGPSSVVPYNLGRIASYEIALWLGLLHPGGSNCSIDADSISDTPIQSPSGCSNPSVVDSCSGLTQAQLGQNFMSYCEDVFKCFFTAGQKAKMWQTLNSARLPLQTSNGCALVGIQNYYDENNISIFPNPSSGVFNLQMNKSENALIKIYNVYGECIYQHTFTPAHPHIDLSSQPAGIYFLKISSDKFTIAKRLSVMK